MSDDYKAAALRHLEDAKSLAAAGRYDNAGHLVGFAGECGLKYQLNVWKLPKSDQEGHHPVPLNKVRRHIERSRMSGRWLALCSGPALFKGWNINDRYAADNTVTNAQYDQWLKDAEKVIYLCNFK